MFGPRKETVDGFESQLATNYLGHFFLTSLLLPKVREHVLVNVSSAAHFAGYWMDFDDLQLKSHYVALRYRAGLRKLHDCPSPDDPLPEQHAEERGEL